MDYLVYIEYNAENLQFYLWYKDYVRRFNALDENKRALSPEWTPESADVPNLAKDSEKEPKKKAKRETIAGMMETGYDAKTATLFSEKENPTSPTRSTLKDNGSIVAPSISDATTLAPSTAEVTAQAGLKWQPCTLTFSNINDSTGFTNM